MYYFLAHFAGSLGERSQEAKMNKLAIVLLMFPMIAMGQDAPLECDNNYGECGTPEMSGGGNAGGGGAILINNTDLGDTYQSADDYDDDGVEDLSLIHI